ncbi:LytTR family DNA-binding domain-containing protein [Fulvivirgaceae bacterium BMA10]|uniref:LytTR family DNA-binding domain-containing protein n=1 Tax=Splendidivirga corallicola TaxID=3051826 RepID=A0ABT8KL89_9BACT|nr:LytTR family DNA-binding domain-containing protein [Fulvivirgaceae bacterium BMA10]
MKQVIIIEDESTAVEKLVAMLQHVDPLIEVVASLESVKETLDWLAKNQKPDLAFVDVQLSDDTSFEIFKQQEISFPVIFTTAYDEYIMESFEYNSIDYLLKPIQEDRLRKALEKVKKLETHFLQHKFNQIFEQGTINNQTFKRRFLVKKGVDYVSVNTKDIAYFFTEYKIVFLRDKKGDKYIIDKTLTELEQELDPDNFFRANRKYLVNIEAIEKFKSDNGKIALQISPATNEEVTVSKENAPNFRKWIEG